MAIRSRGECLSPLTEVIWLCLQALKIHHKRKGEKAGSDGFNERMTFRMVSGLCCSPAPGTRQMCTKAIGCKSIKIHL